MAHIANWDTRLMTLLAAMLGAIALMSDGLGRMMRGGARVGGAAHAGRGREREIPSARHPGTVGVHPAHRAGRIAPARHGGEPEARVPRRCHRSQFTRNPMALASALEKLENDPAPTRTITQGAAHLCIVDPAERKISERSGFLGMSSRPIPDARAGGPVREMAYLGATVPQSR
jgi:hypothetical protein